VILVDANILVYAVDRDSARHEPAREWLEETLSSAEPVGLAWLVVLAFLRVVTRPGLLRRQLAVESALEVVDRLLAAPGARVVEAGPRHWTILRELLADSGAAGNLTSDAHLAALALEQGAAVASFDHDFRRFPGVRLVVPGAKAR
jgi:toxin-antitoxin system PIN domain toxin